MNKHLSTLATLIVLLILYGSTMETHAKVVGYWSFNNSEHIGEDSSPNHNHGELKDRDRTKWVWPGRVGGALQLDGGDGLEVPHDESLNLTDQLTLMCWVKFADLNDFASAQRWRQQSLIWKSAPETQVSYGLYVNRGQLELDLPLYTNNPGRLFSWLYVIDPKCRGQFINGIPDFPARCQRKFAFGLGDSKFGNLGFRASMPGPIAAHAVHPTFFVDFFPNDNPLLDEDDQDFLKEQEQDFINILSHFMIGTSNIYLPRIIRHFENLDRIWFHFAVVADGHSIRLYVNGREKVSERQGSDRQPESFINSQEPLTIGTGLDGTIDEVMILDHALTENEIKEAMDLGKTGRSLAFLSSVDVEITDPSSIAIPVVIPDPNLARWLRTDLGLAPNVPIIRQAMQQLREFHLNSSGIKDLTGLEHATNLEELWLMGNQISDVSPLAGLTKLETLQLVENQISDVSALAGLTNLKRLGLTENQISDVSPLAGLTKLESLWLVNNQISDVSALAGLTNLESLGLHGNPILDTSPLANLTNLSIDIGIIEPVVIPDPNLAAALRRNLGLAPNAPITRMRQVRRLGASSSGIVDLTGLEYATNLEKLWLTENQISDVSPLAGLMNLETLSLSQNQISDVSALAGLTKLEELDLRSNQISDASPLAGLTKLEKLWLGSNPISDTLPLANLTNLSIDIGIIRPVVIPEDEADKLQFLRTLTGHWGAVYSVSFSSDGQTLASGSSDGTIRLWDAKTGRLIRTLEGHTPWVLSVSFSSDGQTLASGGGDTVRLWDVKTGRHFQTIRDPVVGVLSVSFSPDGQTLATYGSDVTVRLWDAKTGRLIRTLTRHTPGVDSMSFSPDGQTLASGHWDGTIRLWDAKTGRLIRTLEGHTDEVRSVSFSPDGQTLASGSLDRTVRLWDVNTGRHLRTLTGHTDGVRSASFSPDGQTLATYGIDATIRLWDVKTGRLLRTLTGQTGGVLSVSFSPDGQRLASGSLDRTVRLWALELSSTTLTHLRVDVNQDGIVNILDLTLVASSFGKSGQNSADVNGDGVVNILDLTLVAGAFENAAGAPALWSRNREVTSTRDQIEQWLHQARQMNLTDPVFQRGVLMLEQLLASLTPKETVLLPNYPNPFNPETWIPYQLAAPADVTISIYAVDGKLVRRLDLGHQPVGMYESRSRAAYWDGHNEFGERVASGLYLYTFTAGNFTATRKMLIRK